MYEMLEVIHSRYISSKRLYMIGARGGPPVTLEREPGRLLCNRIGSLNMSPKRAGEGGGEGRKRSKCEALGSVLARRVLTEFLYDQETVCLTHLPQSDKV